jgi:hypothetical protein
MQDSVLEQEEEARNRIIMPSQPIETARSVKFRSGSFYLLSDIGGLLFLVPAAAYALIWLFLAIPLPENSVRVHEPSPLGWLLEPNQARTLTDRILARLIQSEAREVNPHFKSDHREAFIVVALAAKNDTHPLVSASYRMFGVAPDKVWPHILADRQAKLGKEYSQWYDSAGNLKPEALPSPIPKKPSQSVTRDSKERSA